MKATLFSIAFVTVLNSMIVVRSQTGGSYDLSHNVIGGGGSRSTGGTLEVTGTVGQPQAGTASSGGSYDLRGGFWAYHALVPTAAPVNITGRVMLNSPSSMSR